MIRRQFHRLLLGSAAFAPFAIHAKEGEGFPAADALVRRLLGKVPVRCEKIKGEGDAWTLDRDGDTLVLRGTSPIAIAAALNDWLRHDAKRQLSWTGEYLDLQDKLPLPEQPRSAKASLPHRVAYNFCTYGYTMAWWDWAEWERELDFLALQGVNMPLAMVGHECVWRAVMTRLGMSDLAVRSFLGGPNFLPWEFMANIESWAGPMPESWLESHLDLARKIFARMRELGMTPIVPGFTGYVPVALKELKPNAKIFLKGSWYGFPGTAQLDPSDPMFARISGMFVEETRRLFGEAHWYACDVFHENKPPTSDPAYLASVGKTLIDSLIKADPQAKIAMQTWTLYEPIVKAIPQDRLLLLDLDGRRKEYWGYPYVSGVIHNFGGRVYLGGNLSKSLDFDRHATRDDFKNCQGLGVFCEGSRANSPIYMAALEGTFRSPGAAQNPATWMRTWARSRFGVEDGPAIDAWVSTVEHVYHAGSGASYQSGETPFCMRPTLNGKSSSPFAGSFSRSYALPQLLSAWKQLARDAGRLGKLDTYRYDLVDWGRQALADLGVILHRDLGEAYAKGDAQAFKKTAATFMELGRDLDRLLGTRREFRLGAWLADARRWGKGSAEKRLLERSARILVTLWGPNTQGQVNFDYSNRQWQGLLGSFYLVRWEKYLAYLGGEIGKPASERIDDSKVLGAYGRPGPDNHPFFKELAAWEWNWADRCVGNFTPDAEGDPLALSKELIRKYAVLIEKSVSPLRQTTLPADAYFLGDWASGSLTTAWQKRKWSLEGKLSEGGKFRVTFRFVAGLQRCHVRQVKLLHKGRVVAEDAHEGRTGNEHVENVWRLEFPDLTLADGLELEAEIRSEAGTDSSGVIFAERQP